MKLVEKLALPKIFSPDRFIETKFITHTKNIFYIIRRFK
jgi:hypothetical protein